MKSLVVCLLSLLVSASTASAEAPTVSGHVRLVDGSAVAEAQVLLFDVSDLQRGALGQATTDADGQFALPLGSSALPTRFGLGQNYPNPFNPGTVIPYQLAADGYVRLEVFNLLGQRVATLVEGEMAAGSYTAQWDARDGSGYGVAAGVYVYRLTAGDATATRRMVLVDGPAGGPVSVAGPVRAVDVATDAAEYGLTVAGVGLATYVDAAFAVGAGPVAVVVERTDAMGRGKAAVAGLLGDVDGDGRVDVADALVVAAYSVNATGLVPQGGDVDGDGEVNGEDARLLALYSVDPGHPGLPVGIGLPVGASVVGRVPSLVRGGEVVLSSVDGQVLAETTTDDAGDGFAFAVRPDGLPAWVLVTAVGGVGLDADGDGVVDRGPMAKPGRLRAWVGREYVAGGEALVVNPLTEMAYHALGSRYGEDLSGLAAEEVAAALDSIAQSYLTVEGATYRDLLSFDAAADQGLLRVSWGVLQRQVVAAMNEGAGDAELARRVELVWQRPKVAGVTATAEAIEKVEFVGARQILTMARPDAWGSGVGVLHQAYIDDASGALVDILLEKEPTGRSRVAVGIYKAGNRLSISGVSDILAGVPCTEAGLRDFVQHIIEVWIHEDGPLRLNIHKGLTEKLSNQELAFQINGAAPRAGQLEVIQDDPLIEWRFEGMDDTIIYDSSVMARDGRPLKHGVWFEVRGEGMPFVWIEPGTFWMGSPDSEEGREADEGPRHPVELSEGFWLGTSELTQAQWEAVLGKRPWAGQPQVRSAEYFPAVYISWNDVQAFLYYANFAAGSAMYRLPSEAEWEYACRAGTVTPWPDNEFNTRLHLLSTPGNAFDRGDFAAPVGFDIPNPWGLQFMNGNVWEWVQDRYSSTYYSRSPGVDPLGPSSGSLRVVRGGSFTTEVAAKRSANRQGLAPDYSAPDVGVRLVRQPRFKVALVDDVIALDARPHFAGSPVEHMVDYAWGYSNYTALVSTRLGSGQQLAVPVSAFDDLVDGRGTIEIHLLMTITETLNTNRGVETTQITIHQFESVAIGVPALVVKDPWVSSEQVGSGASFRFFVSVANQGTGTAEDVLVRFYRSADAEITGAGPAEGTIELGTLSASRSEDLYLDLAAPEQAGTYYYGVCVGSAAGEADCSVGVRVEVEGAGAEPGGGGSLGQEQSFSLPGGASMAFVWIEPGVFQMGSDNGSSDERPVHEVEISRGFWLGRFEVTQGEWAAVMGDNPSCYSGDARLPVECVSWYDVHEFIGKLNAASGDSLYRLPSEAEWEYACRAGSTTRWSFGDDAGRLGDYAWYHGNNSSFGTKVVGGKLPNDWGLHDMHGNVSEWVQDWYDSGYYNSPPRVDPPGPDTGSFRVVRGGNFYYNAQTVRSADRYRDSPDARYGAIGVRLVRIR